MGALRLQSRSDLPLDQTWAWLLAAAPDLPPLLAAAHPRLQLTLGAVDPAGRRLAMRLHQGPVTGPFELAAVAAEPGAASIVCSGEVPTGLDDELETVLVLQTVFRRWARVSAPSAPLEPG